MYRMLRWRGTQKGESIIHCMPRARSSQSGLMQVPGTPCILHRTPRENDRSIQIPSLHAIQFGLQDPPHASTRLSPCMYSYTSALHKVINLVLCPLRDISRTRCPKAKTVLPKRASYGGEIRRTRTRFHSMKAKRNAPVIMT